MLRCKGLGCSHEGWGRLGIIAKHVVACWSVEVEDDDEAMQWHVSHLPGGSLSWAGLKSQGADSTCITRTILATQDSHVGMFVVLMCRFCPHSSNRTNRA